MKVKKVRLVIEGGRKQKEDSKFLEGVRKIGEEIFEAIDVSYSDMEDVPTGYYEMMDLIDESYDECGLYFEEDEGEEDVEWEDNCNL